MMGCVGVDWVVFVHDIDRFSLARKLDMDSTATVVGQRGIARGSLSAFLFLFLRLGRLSPSTALGASLASIPQSRAVTVFGVGSGALDILESIGFFNDMEDGPCYGPLGFALVSAIHTAAQGMLDGDGLQMVGRLDQHG